jgi:hypothetical protein
MMLIIDHGICIVWIWRCMSISAATDEILYIYIYIYIYVCMTVVILMRRSVYFLNICYIRVVYRFNRNRVLHGWPCTIKGHSCVSAKGSKIHLRIGKGPDYG